MTGRGVVEQPPGGTEHRTGARIGNQKAQPAQARPVALTSSGVD